MINESKIFELSKDYKENIRVLYISEFILSGVIFIIFMKFLFQEISSSNYDFVNLLQGTVIFGGLMVLMLVPSIGLYKRYKYYYVLDGESITFQSRKNNNYTKKIFWRDMRIKQKKESTYKGFFPVPNIFLYSQSNPSIRITIYPTEKYEEFIDTIHAQVKQYDL